ncbi:FG-GAP and VCBS repeat-containing protein [Streptomyces sp. NPDC005438]|uniref:FG-GAP repeat domain-containing protein n=1 Tax=Streptomyces sp. NPDC005438 TaxID=3156880 RepID=UPI0033A4362E
MPKRARGPVVAGLGVVTAGVVLAAGCTGSGEADGQGPDASKSPGFRANPVQQVTSKDGRVREDFNGDGYNDLAVTSSTRGDSGAAVVVVYGSARGLDPRTRQTLRPDRLRARHSVEGIGAPLTVGDLDGDGVTDLVVQAGWKHDAGIALWGARGKRLSETRASTVHSGRRAVAGDFDGDGHRDLLVSGRFEVTWHRGPFSRDGTPTKKRRIPLRDSEDGVGDFAVGDIDGDGTDDVVARQDFEEVDGNATLLMGGGNGPTQRKWKGPRTGSPVIGDFDGDGHGDLAYRPLEDSLEGDPLGDPGAVRVIYGDRRGLSGRTATVTQNSPGIPGSGQKGDWFGGSLAVGDVDGDGRDDLAVGVPGRTVAGVDRAGATVLLRGSARGLTSAGARTFALGRPGAKGQPEARALFGGAVRLLDLDDDQRAELVNSAPGADDGAGAVWVFPHRAGHPDQGRALVLRPGRSVPRPKAFGLGLQEGSGSPVLDLRQD